MSPMIDSLARFLNEFVDAEYNMIPEPRSSNTITPSIATVHSTSGNLHLDCSRLAVRFTENIFSPPDIINSKSTRSDCTTSFIWILHTKYLCQSYLGCSFATSKKHSQRKLKDFEVKTLTLGSVFYHTNQGDINLNPPYQRNIVWNEKQQGELVQTILDGYPIQSICLHMEAPEKWECMDGKNRIQSIVSFVNGSIHSSDGTEFKGLSEAHQYRFKNINLSICVFRNLTEAEREDYFRRIQGGVKLNKPEIMWSQERHSLMKELKVMRNEMLPSIEVLSKKTKRYDDMTLIVNIVTMLDGKNPVLHSGGMITWLERQDASKNYSGIMGDVKKVIRMLETVVTECPDMNPKVKTHLIIDIAHWIIVNKFKTPDTPKLSKFILDLGKLNMDSKEKTSNVSKTYYANICKSVGGAGYSIKMTHERLQNLKEFLA